MGLCLSWMSGTLAGEPAHEKATPSPPPFDITMRIDTQTGPDFRTQAIDADALHAAIRQARADLDASQLVLAQDPDAPKALADIGRALKRLTQGLMLDGALEEALMTGAQAHQVWVRLGRGKAAFLASLGLAELAGRAGVEDDEVRLGYEALMAKCAQGDLVIYRDFVLESWARELAARGHWADAIAKMRACLSLRRARGNERQLSETQFLLDALQAASS